MSAPGKHLLVFALTVGCARTADPAPADASPPPDAAPDSESIDLRPAASPLLSLTPASHDFGSTAVGAMSAPFKFTLSNSGDGEAAGVKITLNGDSFELTNLDDPCGATPSLPAGARCNLWVRFRPQTRGLKSGSILWSWGGHSESISLSGTGITGDEDRPVISPTSAQLKGTVGIASAPQRFIVANLGNAPVAPVSVGLSGADLGSFAIQNSTCSNPIPPATSCTLEVVLHATTAGFKNAMLTVSRIPGGMAIAQLAGIAVPPSTLTIAPSRVDFGSVAVGATSAAFVFEVGNVGSTGVGPLDVVPGTAEFQLTNSSTCQGAVLSAGAVCTISLVFRPTSTGPRSTALTVTSPQDQQTFAGISGTGL